MKHNIFLPAAFVFFIISCSSKDKDLSYSADEYVAMGMTDYKITWDQNDFVDVLTDLNKLKMTRPLSLPRKNSLKSEKYFNRMLANDNFSFLKNDTISLSDKAFRIQYYSNIPNELVKIYSQGTDKLQYYHHELVHIYHFGLEVSQKKLDLAQEIMASEDPQIKALQRGTKSVQTGYIEMVVYIIENQTNKKLFTEKDMREISEFVSKSITQNKSWLVSRGGNRIHEKLASFVKNSEEESAKIIYQDLLNAW